MARYEEYIVVDKDGNPIKQSFKARFKRGFHECVEWVGDHEQLCMVALPIAASIIAVTTKAVVKQVNLGKEAKLKDCRCYDSSLGHYWELRRKLTNKEWIDIEHRRINGERLADILESLHVLR